MIGLVLASLILGSNGAAAPMDAAPTAAAIDSSLPTDGDNGRVEGIVQRALTPADTITSVYLISGYALVGWSEGGHPAGQAILSRSTGMWRILAKGGGVFDEQGLVDLGISHRDAYTLVNGATPVTPDVGYTPLLGAWQCAGTGRQEFAMDPSGRWLTFHGALSGAAGASGSFDSYFYWEAATRHWSTAGLGAQGAVFAARSDGWRNGALTFNGTQTTPRATNDARETLEIAADGSLSNLIEIRTGHGWDALSSSHCVKLTP